MAPEYGATCGIFPVDAETLKYLRLTGRNEEQVALVEAYYRAQGMFHTADAAEAEYSSTLELDLNTVEPSVAGPKRPQDRVLLSQAGPSFAKQLPALQGPNANKGVVRQMVRWEGEGGHTSAAGDLASSVGAPVAVAETSVQELMHSVQKRFGVDPDKYLCDGSIVIAAITSCTNTSNP
jgi:aconitate hydratase